MKKSVLTALAVGLGLTVTVTACGNSSSGTSNSSSNNSSASSSKPINLTFFWWGNTTRDKLTEKAIADYEKLHPNVHITPEFDGSFKDYWQKLTTQIAGGNAPDIMQQDYDYINEYASRGALLNMSNLGISTSNISSSVLKDGVINGNLYGIPNSLNAYALFYNPNLMKQAGVQVNSNTRWTWSQYANVINQVHTKLGIYGADDPEDYQHFAVWARQAGQSLYSSDQKSVGYTASTLENYFNYWAQLRQTGAVPNGATMLAHKMGKSTDLFDTGKVASFIYWSNLYGSLNKATSQPYQMMLPPYTPGQNEGLYVKPSQFWSISSTTKHPKQAAEFVNWLLNSVQANEDLGTERGIPVSSAIRSAMEKTASPANKVQFEYMNKVLSVAKTPLGPPSPPASDQILSAFTTTLGELTYNKETPKQAAPQFITQANQLLSQGQ